MFNLNLFFQIQPSLQIIVLVPAYLKVQLQKMQFMQNRNKLVRLVQWLRWLTLISVDGVQSLVKVVVFFNNGVSLCFMCSDQHLKYCMPCDQQFAIGLDKRGSFVTSMGRQLRVPFKWVNGCCRPFDVSCGSLIQKFIHKKTFQFLSFGSTTIIYN